MISVKTVLAVFISGIGVYGIDQDARLEPAKIPQNLPPAFSPARSYQVAIDKGIIYIRVENLGAGFSSSLQSRIGPNIKTLSLTSNGGLVREAKSLGDYIESHNLNTLALVGDLCASSCLAVFSSGNNRETQNGALFGIHATTNPNPQYNRGYCDYIQRRFSSGQREWLCSLIGSIPNSELVTLSGATIYYNSRIATKLINNNRPLGLDWSTYKY